MRPGPETVDPTGVRLWDVASAAPAGPHVATGQLPCFQFTPAGDTLLVLDTAARQLINIDPETGRPKAPAVALSDQDADVAVVDRPELSPLSLACAFRRDGALVVESPTSSVAQQYDVRNGRPIGPPMDHGDTIGWLAYSPDGATLASACSEGTVRLWDARTARPLGPPLAHGLPALGVFFSPDSATLTVVTMDARATSGPVPQPSAVDDPAALRLWVETVSGLRSTERAELADLTLEAWQRDRERLRQLWPDAVPDSDGRSALARWHRDGADDARRLDDHAAYRDHLDRLDALDPGDWLPAALRADSFTETGRLDEAAAELARAARHAPPEDLTSWLWYRAVESLVSRQYVVALGYIDRVIAARPDDWKVHAHRAEILERLGRTADALAAHDHAASLKADPSYISEMVGVRAALGDWQAAARLLALFAARGANDHVDRALICLRCNDQAGYRRACASILASIAAAPVSPPETLHAAWTIGLAPNAVDDYKQPLALAESVLTALARLKAPENVVRAYHHDAIQTHAALQLRAGRTSDALADLAKATALIKSDPVDGLLAAIAQVQNGQIAEAKARLSAALTAIAAESARSTSWKRKAELDLLKAEAECALLDSVFPAQPFA